MAKKTDGKKPKRVSNKAKGDYGNSPILALAEPWYMQQKYERPGHFDLFRLFRDMGGARSKKQVAEDAGLSELHVGRLAHKFRWDERAQAYDDMLEAEKVKAAAKEAADMGRRQARLGMRLQEKADQGLDMLDVSEMSARDVAILAETGAKLERTARGADDANNRAGQTIILNIPIIPGWAKASPFVMSDPDKKPGVTITHELVQQPKALEGAKSDAK